MFHPAFRGETKYLWTHHARSMRNAIYLPSKSIVAPGERSDNGNSGFNRYEIA